MSYESRGKKWLTINGFEDLLPKKEDLLAKLRSPDQRVDCVDNDSLIAMEIRVNYFLDRKEQAGVPFDRVLAYKHLLEIGIEEYKRVKLERLKPGQAPWSDSCEGYVRDAALSHIAHKVPILFEEHLRRRETYQTLASTGARNPRRGNRRR